MHAALCRLQHPIRLKGSHEFPIICGQYSDTQKTIYLLYLNLPLTTYSEIKQGESNKLK